MPLIPPRAPANPTLETHMTDPETAPPPPKAGLYLLHAHRRSWRSSPSRPLNTRVLYGS
jgi:hypothetical protein